LIKLVLDGTKTFICSKKAFLSSTADVLLDVPNLNEIYLEFIVSFDVEAEFAENAATCSPVGIQIRII